MTRAKKNKNGPGLPPPSAPRWWNQNWLLGLLLFAAVLIAYQPAGNAGFIWDDDDYVTNNHLLTAPDGLPRIWFSLDSPSQYFPLTYTVFRWEHALWGLHPAGFHWVNILLHAGNALLGWRLLSRLQIPGAWLAAAIFALHPVNVESVAWITQLKNVQSLFFSLLTLLAWVEFVAEQPRWRWYALALLFYALALCSKTTACTLPAALLLILWLQKKPLSGQRLLQVFPFVAFGIGMGLVSMWWEKHHQGTAGAVYAIGFLERLLIASRAVWFYAGKFLWPVNLAFNYPLWKINPADALAYGWLAAGAALGAVIYFTRRFVGRSVEVAAVFYVAMLSPLLGFIMLYTFRYTFVADHYQYVATLGPAALAAAALSTGAWWSKKNGVFLKPVFCAGLLTVLGVLTWRQCGMYANLETLWRTTIARNPQSFMAHNNLGTVLLQRGQLDQAMTCFRAALAIQPDSPNAHFNIGQLLLQAGQVEEAAAHFRQVLAMQPYDARMHCDLAAILLQQGRPEDALAHCQSALKTEPDSVAAHYILASSLFQNGRVVEAIAHFQKVAELQPDNAEVHNNLGWSLLQNGRPEEAIAQFQTVLKLDSTFVMAHGNLARAFLQKGQAREAVAQYQSLLQRQPDVAPVLSELAWLLATWPEAAVRNGTQALELARRAEQLSRGQNPLILQTLAAAYAEGGQFTQAVTTAQHAVELADSQTNAALGQALRTQLQSYQAGSPFRDAGPTPANHPD